MKTTSRCKMVPYYRTSTDDQRLGIDAQQATATRIASERGCTIVKDFVEHESGGHNERPELAKAIRYARRIGAIVVVAKLDRLSRDSRFLMTLHDGDVPIIFGDLPEVDGSAASRLIIQMMANIAEFERRRIGERTKEALAELKAKGVQLGTPANLGYDDRVKGAHISAEKVRALAVEQMSDVAEVAIPMRKEGRTLAEIATYLNENEYLTRNGGAWTPTQVKRVIDRAVTEKLSN
jgi:DNA invertase Pin-like site-specific DNA recombinase